MCGECKGGDVAVVAEWPAALWQPTFPVWIPLAAGSPEALQDEACRQMIINCSALEHKVIKVVLSVGAIGGGYETTACQSDARKKDYPESVRK